MIAETVEELFAPPPDAEKHPLTPAQQGAAEASLDPQIVLAGPGTGKTRVLVYRAAYLLLSTEHDIRPEDLVVVTFTTKAAAQLRRRLHTLIGPRAQSVRAGTIHHFCFRLLKEFADQSRAPDDFIVADETVSQTFWESWCEDNDRGGDHRQIMTEVSCYVLGEGMLTQDLIDANNTYRETLHGRGYLDFDDLLLFTRHLLRDNPAVLKEIRSGIRALLVDEFQDTDPVQYDVLNAAARPESGGLFCVADDDQSIYGFRGARPENVKEFITKHDCTKNADTYHVLDVNYRSHENIFQLAESVLDVQDRLKQSGDVETDAQGKGHALALIPCQTEGCEREKVLTLVQEWIEDGTPAEEIAVLTPWNNTNAACEEYFLREGIPCDVSGRSRLLETGVAHALHALFRLLHKRLCGQHADEELEAFLQVVLSKRAFSRLKEVAHRFRNANEPLAQAFSALVVRPSVASDVGLAGPEREEIEHAFSLLLNARQQIRQPDVTIGGIAREVIPKLSGPLQLLAQAEKRLRDPFDDASTQHASTALRRWLSERSSEHRLLVHHERRSVERLWAPFIRFALESIGGEETSSWVLSLAEAEPPGEQDLLLTGTPEGLTDRLGELSRRSPPPIISIDVENNMPRTVLRQRLEAHDLFDGFASADVHVVGSEGQYESPSVALFKLFQGALAPQDQPFRSEYIMVDLETTSPDPKHCRIAEIGAIKVQNGAVVDTFQTLAALPDDLTDAEQKTLREVSGFELSEFRDAPPLKKAFEGFCAFAGAAPLVAHNGQQFDFAVLRRLQKEFPDVDAPWTETYDMLPLARELFPDLDSHSAGALRETLLGKEEEDTAHRAVQDCRDQNRLLEALQQARARRGRTCQLEPLLPAIAAAMAAEPDTRVQHADSEEALLLRAGYQLALRGGHELLGEITRLPGQASAAKAIRSRPRFAEIVEEVVFKESASAPLDLQARLEALIAPYADAAPADELAPFLAHLALWGEEEANLERAGGSVVTISTYHSAKGLEFEHVICTGLHNSAFPAFHCETDEDRKEFRRLLYVGMTRAEKRLVLTYPKRDQFDRPNRRSPYLRDALRKDLVMVEDTYQAVPREQN